VDDDAAKTQKGEAVDISEAGSSDGEEELTRDFMGKVEANTREYAHEAPDAIRDDTTETVFYATAMKTKNGRASGSFQLSGLITKFRITANAFNKEGVIGYKEASFQSRKDFYIEFEVPSSMVLTDKLTIPVFIFNNMEHDVEVLLEFENSDKLGLSQNQISEIQVASRSTGSADIVVEAAGVGEGEFLFVRAMGVYQDMAFGDEKRQFLNLLAPGFPRSETKGGFIGSQIRQQVIPSEMEMEFTINETISIPSIQVDAKVFSSNFASLTAAVEKLIKDPYGCFEQTSATTYPQVMALQFLQSLPEQDDKVTELKIGLEDKIKKGYDRLVTFQTSDKGFEWFGEYPAHEALSAFGYYEFVDMS